MKSSTIIRNELAHYRENELIFASEFFREHLSGYITEVAFYKMLERMYSSGELCKAAKGIYYIPSVSKYGIVPLSDSQIVEAFTKKETGMVVGYSMYNRLNLTTQVSKNVNVLSSAIDGFSRTIRNVAVKQIPLKFSKEVKNMVSGLEVLQNFYEIQDMDYVAFIDYSKTLAADYKDEVFELVISKISYKKSTISFLREILRYYEVANSLDRYLSALSAYKHPRMEEIYEIARVS